MPWCARRMASSWPSSIWQLRGPGEFFGTRQAGLPDFRVANLLRDRELLELAQPEAARFVETGEKDLPAPRSRAVGASAGALAASIMVGRGRLSRYACDRRFYTGLIRTNRRKWTNERTVVECAQIADRWR